MKDLKDIVEALEKDLYDLTPRYFEGQEPDDCAQFCKDWFNKQPIDYKIGQVSFAVWGSGVNDVLWHIDFRDALNLYYGEGGCTIPDACYRVILHPVRGAKIEKCRHQLDR